ncbi:MAG: tRNA (adenosine(37)-N6)-threonylcarbamoyltransferase complex transferase subunit TsaD [Candidatus Paceibacterota bacterium]|jgi:N6-L-threonylcarbamoyladenine synthase
MIILSIETSCDETAISIVEANGGIEKPSFKTIVHLVNSQTELHKQYGGVFPIMAKRAHAENITPLLRTALENIGTKNKNETIIPEKLKQDIKEILTREETAFEPLIKLFSEKEIPAIDAIAVTIGPGLEPALWVGINVARALSIAWDKPLIPANHMEGHIISVLASATERHIQFPALALLISGGHTELILAKSWSDYRILGETRDDAVGESFDKVARTLGLPYPGGPEISKLAQEMRAIGKTSRFKLPRPMIHSKDYDFSFSGLKTSVLYTVQKLEALTPEIVSEMALAFEDSVADVLTYKTRLALTETSAQTIILGGGVISNIHIRESFARLIKNDFSDVKLFLPEKDLTTDNATMIGMAGYLEYLRNGKEIESTRAPLLVAKGNLRLSNN